MRIKAAYRRQQAQISNSDFSERASTFCVLRTESLAVPGQLQNANRVASGMAHHLFRAQQVRYQASWQNLHQPEDNISIVGPTSKLEMDMAIMALRWRCWLSRGPDASDAADKGFLDAPRLSERPEV